MRMPYPDHGTYASLYARYLIGGRTEQLLDLAGDLKGKLVLDLCAGGGRLSRLAAARGAIVTAIDECPSMLQEIPEVVTKVNTVEAWLQSYCGSEQYDTIFTQQAVNYWLTPELAFLVADSLKPQGAFIFNTFNQAPGFTPKVKQYSINGIEFTELSWRSDGTTVEHVQIRQNEPPHTTRFKWIPPDAYKLWLSPFLNVREIIDGTSSIWICSKP